MTSSPAPNTAPNGVSRRKVIYIHGFEPKSPARYRALYRMESTRWTKLFGGRVKVGASNKDAPIGLGAQTNWTINAQIEPGAPVRIDYQVPHWKDLVEKEFDQPLWRRILRGLAVFAIIIFDGSLWQMMRQAWIPVVGTVYPFLLLLVYVIAALTLTLAPPLAAPELLGGPWWAYALGGAATAWAFLRWTARIDDRIYVYYAMDFFAHMRNFARGMEPGLEARAESFSQAIQEAARGPYDEVLVVGHSAGAMLAADALGRALAADPQLTKHGPAISLLTLGNTILAQNQFPQAHGIRENMRRVARCADAMWLDVSSRADSVCYSLCDPLIEKGVSLPSSERRAGPKIISAAFSDTVGPEAYEAIRRNQYRRHFQYLYVFENPGAFDYFRITAGPLTLKRRFANVSSNRRAPKTADELQAPSTALEKV